MYKGAIRNVKECQIEPLQDLIRGFDGQLPYFSLSSAWLISWLELVRDNADVWVYQCTLNEETVALCFISQCTVKRLNDRISIRQLQINEYTGAGFDMVISYNGMIGSSEHIASAWKSLFEELVNMPLKWDELSVSALPENQLAMAKAAATSLQTIVDKVFYRWSLDLNSIDGDSVNGLIDSFKRKSRQQLRQSYRAFQERGDLEIRLAESLDEALLFFTEMERLHAERWKKVGKAGSYSNKNWVRFHESIIRLGFDSGCICVYRIKSGGDVIGFLYGHTWGDTLFMHQTGFADMGENRLRPGYISHVLAMHDCCIRGTRCYDFLPDAEDSYKRFFVEKGEPVYWLFFQKSTPAILAERALRKLARKPLQVVDLDS